MNHTLSNRLSQFMTHFQVDLWDWQQEDPLELTPKLRTCLEKVIHGMIQLRIIILKSKLRDKIYVR